MGFDSVSLAPVGPHVTWEAIEIDLRATERMENPYLNAEVHATFEHESGETHEIPGFWDGGRDWCVRFAPPQPGTWSWSTRSDPGDLGLDRSGTLDVVSYEGENPLKRHGFLEPRERHLAHADGTPFFWLGDTVWSASAKATPEEWTDYLDARTAQGYNVVQLNALPQHDAARPYRRLPFGEEWDLDAPRPSYFRALDGMVQAANARGVVPTIVVLWFNYVAGTNEDWGEFPRHTFDEEQAERWGRYLAARYGAYGATWFIAGDWEFSEEPLPVFDAAAKAIRSGTTHPVCASHLPGGRTTAAPLNERDWLDIHAHQSGHHRGDDGRDAPRKLAEHHRAMSPTRPVLDSEPCYENMGSARDGVRFTRREVRTAGWQSVLSGANAGLTYGGNGIWQWYREGEHFEGVDWIEWMREPLPWHEGLAYPAAKDYAFLKSFLSSFTFESLEPSQEVLVDEDPSIRAAELPEDGVLLVYAPEANRLELDLARSLEGAEWLHPGTQQRVEATVDAGGERITIDGPPWTADGLLIVQ